MYKKLQIIYDSYLAEYLYNLLEEQDIRDYAVVPCIELPWKEGIKHLGNYTIPKVDSTIFLILESDKASELILEFRKLKEKSTVSFSVLISTLDEII